MQRAGQSKDGTADLGKARQQFEEVIAKDPKNYRVLLLLSQTLKLQKESAKAKEMLKQVLTLASEPVDPKAPDKDAQTAARQGTQELANLTLAQIEYETKNLDGSLAYLDASLKLNPGNAQSYLLRARVQMERKQPEAARKDFQFALDIAQRLPDGLEQRAILMNALDGLKELSPKGSPTPTPKGSATPSLPVSLPTAAPSSVNSSVLPSPSPASPVNATTGNTTPQP
jgi:tetratricopeptide (TPR) repeat protein